MSFSRVKPGDWSTGEVLTSTQMNSLDTNVSQAVDGTGGGTYAPSSAIQIGGSGIQVTGAANLQNITAATLNAEPTYGSAQSVIRVQPLVPAISTNWSFDTSTLVWNQDVASNEIWFPLNNIPGNCTITSIRMFVSGTGTSGVLRLIKQDNAGSVTTIASGSDGAGPALRTLTVTVASGGGVDWNGAGGVASHYAKLEGSTSTGYKVHHLWCVYNVTATLY